MSESNPWADQWQKAQQQFVSAWSDMATAGTAQQEKSQASIWADSFDLWRKACMAPNQPDVKQVMDKSMDMARGYFTMAEQIGKQMSKGAKPAEAMTQWLEQLKDSMGQFGSMPGAELNDFMQQWFKPASSWQQMAGMLNPAMMQMPGMGSGAFNMGEAMDPMGKMLSAPGIGYYREPQEQQQKGVQLGIDYQQANYKFNQAFLKVSMESIQGFQQRLMSADSEDTPKSLRQLYDLWVEVSEQHYAEFAMSEEYQELYGDMVNRLMTLKIHYGKMTDDTLRQMNLPSTTEVDTMQMRLQQQRRENIQLKKDITEIKSMLKTKAPAPERTAVKKATPVAAAKKLAPAEAPKKAAPVAAAKKTAPAAAPKKPAPAKQAAAKKASAKKAVPKKPSPSKKTGVNK